MRTRSSSWKKRYNGSKQRYALRPTRCSIRVFSLRLLIILIPTFKVGKAVYARKIFRRLLVFASDASTSAPTATATAYTPCHASYTNYTSGD